MNRWRRALVVLLLIPAAQAQSADTSGTGVVTGSAFDSHHVPIPAATVYLRPSGKNEWLKAQTDSAGIYRFTVLSGTYMLRAETHGKDEASAGPFTIERNKLITVDLILQPSAAAQPQFFDEPQFVVAGVTDNTYRGGHGSDTVLRSAEALAKATASLSNASKSANAADTHHALAEIDERSGHPLEAAREFQVAAELNPTEPNLFDWGIELLTHRAPRPAIEVFTNGIRLFPRSVRMALGLATAWYSAGEYDQAAQSFFKAADIDPNDPNPYLFLGKVQSRQITESSGYEERLERFARLQPNNALANYYYAVSIWNWRRGPDDFEAFARTRSLLERAVALDPHLGPAYLHLGIVCAAERRYSDAIRAYRKAIETSPELEETHYRLSEAYRLTGDREKAERELVVYNQLSKQSAEQVERERRQIQQFVVALRSQSPVSETKEIH